MTDEEKSIRPSLLSICNIVALQYSGINFIAPLRNNPERNYLIKGNVDSVGVSGENAPILLGKIGKRRISTDIFCPFTNKITPDEYGQISINYNDLLQQWITYLELGELKVEGDNGFVSLEISGHNIADVGFGVSQALPILLQGIYMYKDQTLLLEQPEIHLHPQNAVMHGRLSYRISKT